MSQSTTVEQREPRWGLPRVSGHSKLLSAASIDSFGSGLLFAFQIVYFERATALSLAEVGLALTLAQLLALPGPTLFGPVVDRLGPRAVAAIANLVAGAGFLGYVFAESFWQIVMFGFVAQFGISGYWTSYGALVALAAGPGGRTRWFGLMQAIRNAGIGLGGAVSAAVVALDGVTWLRGLILVNAISYACAALLLLMWKPEPFDEEPPDVTGPESDSTETVAPQKERAGYGVVLRDRVYLRLVAVNFVFVLSAMVLNVLLAIYIVESLAGLVWLAGALLTVNTLLVATTQTVVSGWVERHAASRALILAAVTNAVSFAIFGLAGVLPGWLVIPGLVLAIVLFTLAELVQSPAMSTLSVSLAAPALRGRYLAVYQMSWTIGGAIAPVVFTTLLSYGPGWPWAVLAALSLLSVLALTGSRATTRS